MEFECAFDVKTKMLFLCRSWTEFLIDTPCEQEFALVWLSNVVPPTTIRIFCLPVPAAAAETYEFYVYFWFLQCDLYVIFDYILWHFVFNGGISKNKQTNLAFLSCIHKGNGSTMIIKIK